MSTLYNWEPAVDHSWHAPRWWLNRPVKLTGPVFTKGRLSVLANYLGLKHGRQYQPGEILHVETNLHGGFDLKAQDGSRVLGVPSYKFDVAIYKKEQL